MKNNFAQNNKGSTYIIVIVALVSVLILSIGSYFLFFNKGSNPLLVLTNKCSGNEKACTHFDNINKYREEKKLSPLKWDSEICSRIQSFANDLKEIYKDESNVVFNTSTRKTFDNLRNDSKYKDLIGEYSGIEEERNKDRRVMYDIQVKELGDLKVDLDNRVYGPKYKEDLTKSYTHGCIVVSDPKIDGKNDFAAFYFVELRN